MAHYRVKHVLLSSTILFLCVSAVSQSQHVCADDKTMVANVVALYQPYMFNRLGAAAPQGMIFALESDVVPMDNPVDQYGNDIKLHVPADALKSGQVRLRSDKRARPLVLRVNQGECLEIHFRNLLGPTIPPYLNNTKLVPNTNVASIHLSGLDLLETINSDGSWVGKNSSSLAQPDGKEVIYRYFAPAEGTFMLYSTGDIENAPSGLQLQSGMFGAVNVQPPQAEYYRSQVTREDLHLATFNKNSLPPNMHLTPKMGVGGQPLRVEVRPSVFARALPPAQLNTEIYVLTTINHNRQTFETADVVLDPDGYIYALDTEDEGNELEPGEYTARAAPKAGPHTGHPIVNYAARYPANDTYGRACYPILRMSAHAAQGEKCQPGSGKPQLYYSDLTAIITGPGAGRFPYTEVQPTFNENSAEPDRREPYREFTIIYHNNPNSVQAFQQFYSTQLSKMLGAAKDSFAINYGIAGIGSEILANRMGVGPEGNADAVDLKFEEFFLASWAVGDPAILVDIPANAQNQVVRSPQPPTPPPPSGMCPATTSKEYSPGKPCVDNNRLVNEPKNTGWTAYTKEPATKAYYPDDPSNVYHSYMRDHVKFRILHAGGSGATHVHHLHAHQWLHSPNSSDSQYLDSQMLTPGAAYTLEVTYGGSGNRNLTVGDSIFHCHFYPHFAGGMWALWRVHDVFEEGTVLGPDRTTPAPGINRVLPDGEIRAGTPIPAIVPMPTLAMAPFPADVKLVDALASGDHRRIEVIPDKIVDGAPVYSNPGFPFFVPGVAGHRAPHPPLDFAWKVDTNGIPIFQNGHKELLDGGLPRHLILNGKIYREFHTNWDFTKDFVLYDSNHNLKDGNVMAFELPEEGTAVERAAMAAHSQRAHRTFLPNGDPGNFILNGLPPVSGAPFASPAVTAFGDAQVNTRRYKGANIQIDTVLNKKGWHFPQQRLITLWSDVAPTVSGQRPPQPFFFRSATGETVEYWQTNLVPSYYEMDDFEVRTPTDIIGQHIHLVKFDVLASDGSSNGFNYEDGTLSPDEVRERIFAINQVGGLYAFDDGPRQFYNPNPQLQKKLRVHSYAEDYPTPNCSTPPCPSLFGQPPAGQDWNGAQTTVQLWGTDPLVNNKGFDRTLRTVFTHDHFGPSTHQQAGLYAALVVEPENSKWYDSTSGQQLYDTTSCYNPSTLQYQKNPGECPSGTYRRTDGGPTTWQANIVTAHSEDSYREFVLEFQDMQLAYLNTSTSKVLIPTTALFTNSTTITLKPGVIPATDPVRGIFSANGITLSALAVASSVTKCGGTLSSVSANWLIRDPAPPDMDEEYCIANTSNSASVYLPDMEPGWSNPANAVNSPSPAKGASQTISQISRSNGIVTVTAQSSTNLVVGGTVNISGVSDKSFNGIFVVASTPSAAQFTYNQSGNASSASSGTWNVMISAPTIISSGTQGTESVNYRNEPVPLRVYNPGSGTAPANSLDLSYAFSSITRSDPALNTQPTPGTPINPGNPSGFAFPALLVPGNSATSTQGTDPFTPMLRAYQGDKIQIRTLVGAHTNLHSLHIPGIKWMFEPTYANSGFRDTQGMGISEHWEMLFDLPHTTSSPVNPSSPPPQNPTATDYLYETNAGVDGVTNGIWGILRAFNTSQGALPNLQSLPNNPMPQNAKIPNPCAGQNPASVQLVAISSAEALANQSTYPGQLIYNNRGQAKNQGFAYSAALMYVRKDDLNTTGSNWTLSPNVPIEPLILRVNAGSCLQVTLTNRLPGPSAPEQFLTSILQSSPFGKSTIPQPSALPVSSSAALIPGLLFSSPNTPNGLGFNVGFNNPQTVSSAGTSAPFTWFAGNADGTPMEAGTVLLEPSDPLLQHFSGLVGVLVVEPPGATWQEDANTRAAATVTMADGSKFRELVLVGQNDIDNQDNSNTFPNVQAGFNYRSEPFAGTPNSDPSQNVYRWPKQNAALTAKRKGKPQAKKTLAQELAEVQKTDASITLSDLERNNAGFTEHALESHPEVLEQLKPRTLTTSQGTLVTERYSNDLVKGDPETPILYTSAGMPVRIHMAFAGGTAVVPGVFTIHGHHWQEEPWTHDGSRLGFNPLSQTFGMEQVVPYQLSNFLLDSAGGADLVSGDYLYEMIQNNAQNGMWGLLRVEGVSVVISQASTTQIAGSVMVKRGGTMPTSVEVKSASGGCNASPNPDGSWSCSLSSSVGTQVTATTAQGGRYTATVH